MKKLCECGCGGEVTSKKKKSRFINGHNKAWLGKKMSDGHREKMSKARIGIKLTSESKEKMSKSRRSLEYKEKYKKTCLEKYGVDSSSKSEEVKNKQKRTFIEKYGFEYWSQTLQGREFARINAIRQIERQRVNNEPLTPRIGLQERSCLDEFQIQTPFTIIRNDGSFKGLIGRFPDGHIPELKLFIQFDERNHFLDSEMKIYKQDDIDCTLQLASLGYIVFRVSEKDWKENKEKVVEQFTLLL